jgi:hypothetical protein
MEYGKEIPGPRKIEIKSRESNRNQEIFLHGEDVFTFWAEGIGKIKSTDNKKTIHYRNGLFYER